MNVENSMIETLIQAGTAVSLIQKTGSEPKQEEGKTLIFEEVPVITNTVEVKNEIIESEKNSISKNDCSCDIHFQKESDRKQHVKIIHKYYKVCEICAQTFKTEEVRIHMLMHTKSKEKQEYPVFCEDCGYSANTKGNLVKHRQLQHDYSSQTCQKFVTHTETLRQTQQLSRCSCQFFVHSSLYCAVVES